MLRVSQGFQGAERGIALSGPPAREWLSERGFLPAEGDSMVRVAGDAMRTEDFAIVRLWHNASSLERSPTDGGLVMGFLLEGEVSLDVDEKAVMISGGGGYSYRSPWSLREDAGGSTAFIEAHLGSDAQRRLGVSMGDGIERIRPGLTSARVFVNAVSTMLSAPLEPSDPHYSDLQRSVEYAIRAVLREADITGVPQSSSRAVRLRQRATAVIERRHWDTGFGVALLAEELGVSKSGLHAAFAEVETTPLMELRRARVATAIALLEAGDLTLREVARAAGFRSSDALSRARRHHRSTEP